MHILARASYDARLTTRVLARASKEALAKARLKRSVCYNARAKTRVLQEVAEKEKADRSRVQVNSITNIMACSVLIDGNLGNTVTPKRPSEENAQRY